MILASWRSAPVPALVAFLTLPVGPASANAAEGDAGWWGGLEIGGVALRQETAGQGGGKSHGELAMAFRAGVALGPQWRVGGEIGGFTLEPGNLERPDVGRGIAQYRVVAERHFGEPGRGGWVGLAAGYAQLWSNHADEASRSGRSATLATGMLWPIGETLGSVGATLGYTRGDAGDLRFSGWHLGVNWAFY